MTIRLTSKQLKDFYQKNDNTVAFECSDVDIKGNLSLSVTLLNTDTGGSKTYIYCGLDRSDSGEDIAGWWFKAKSGDGQKLLIIND